MLAKILILHQEKVKELERKLNFLEEGINLNKKNNLYQKSHHNKK